MKNFNKGFKDAFPVFLGYFGVSFSLGIAAKNAGLTAFQASLMSLLNSTSAGQAAAIEIIGRGGSYIELAVSQIVINMRYLLMSAALTLRVSSQKTSERLLMSMGITDEIFGLSYNQELPLSPFYTFGCYCMALPGWVAGTFLGVTLGNILPATVVSSLSMALYSMFIAIVLPPAKKNHIVAVIVFVSMLLSWLFSVLFPVVSGGMRVIILTVVISAIAAWLFPVKEEDKDE